MTPDHRGGKFWTDNLTCMKQKGEGSYLKVFETRNSHHPVAYHNHLTPNSITGTNLLSPDIQLDDILFKRRINYYRLGFFLMHTKE